MDTDFKQRVMSEIKLRLWDMGYVIHMIYFLGPLFLETNTFIWLKYALMY